MSIRIVCGLEMCYCKNRCKYRYTSLIADNVSLNMLDTCRIWTCITWK